MSSEFSHISEAFSLDQVQLKKAMPWGKPVIPDKHLTVKRLGRGYTSEFVIPFVTLIRVREERAIQ
jgi:hypothetical protein